MSPLPSGLCEFVTTIAATGSFEVPHFDEIWQGGGDVVLRKPLGFSDF